MEIIRREAVHGLALLLAGVLALPGLTACGEAPDAGREGRAPGPTAADSGWVPIFNGQDLTGWTPKIRHSVAGLDSLETFRVVDGLLTVSYDHYDTFSDRFGHLFYDRPLSSYDLRVEYRIVGDQLSDGESWARANSGVMFHAQSPASMPPEQDFPISLEAQLLGGLGDGPRPTGNLCTPGTDVEVQGVRTEEHCIGSSSPTFDGDGWVTLELIVRGDDRIVHLIDGDTVLTYAHPRIGGGVVNGFDPAAKVDGTPLTEGYIALQSESHPVQFRTIWLREVPPGA
jgi:hypothetical protein